MCLLNFELIFLREKYLVGIIKYWSLEISLAKKFTQVGTAFKKPVTMWVMKKKWKKPRENIRKCESLHPVEFLQEILAN